MGSDEKSEAVSKQPLTDDQRKALSKQSHKSEVASLMSQQAKWSAEPTQFDHLPAHEKPFPIEPFPHERQRLPFKMSDEDRMRRKIWVKSQELTEREPVRVPELETMLYNPIRRLYRGPTDKAFSLIAPLVSEHRVPLFRFFVPKLFLGWLGACALWYNVKYTPANWEEKKGVTFLQAKGIYLPEEEKPAIPKHYEYADKGFTSRTSHKGSDYAY